MTVKHLLFSIACGLCFQGFSQYSDPNIAKPSTGYGSDGPHPVGVLTMPNPHFAGTNIQVYYPSDITTNVPALFYSHGYGGNNSANISGLLNFVAMKGYAIVFVPYQTLGVTVPDRYTNLQDGFTQAARTYTNVIDTTRTGFMGHSFGGGASFGLSDYFFSTLHWGQNGRFIYAMAQWYSYNITQNDLLNFPANTQLLTEVFDNDSTNDHRMAVDIFNTISIPASEKNFIRLKGDTLNGYAYIANHNVPNTTIALDAYDYYGIYRLLDALCDYSFHGSLAGKNVALGNGSPAQVTMPGGLKPLDWMNPPVALYPQSQYQFPCNDALNPRIAYCSSPSTGIEEPAGETYGLAVYPNPASHFVTVGTTGEAPVEVYTSLGNRVLQSTGSLLNVSDLAPGIYMIVSGLRHATFVKE